MKFLIVCKEAPTQLISARLYKLAKYLRTFHEVALICQKSETIKPLELAGIKVYVKESNYEYLANLAEKDFDVIIFANWYLAEVYYGFVKKYYTNSKIVIDASDLQFIRDEKMIELSSKYTKNVISSGEVMKNKNEELEVYTLADVCWVSSEDEKAALKQYISLTNVEVVASIYDTKASYRGNVNKNTTYFIGNSYRQSNIDASKWFAEEIFDNVRNEIKDFSISFIGEYNQEFREKYNKEGIYYKAFRDIEFDIEFCLKQYDICVIPVRFFSGLDERLVDAIVNEIPIVTTSVIANALKLKHEDDVLVCDTAQEFADAIKILLNDNILKDKLVLNAKDKLYTNADLSRVNERIFKHFIWKKNLHEITIC